LIVAAGLAAGLQEHIALAQHSAPAPSSQGEKKIVRTADDLPTHEYEIEHKPSEFLEVGDDVFGAFVKQVRSNIENELATLDIQDRTTLRDRHSLLAQIAFHEGRDADVRKHLGLARENELKEASKLMMGHVQEAMLAAKSAAGGMKVQDAAFVSAFEKMLGERWSALPWDKVAEQVKQQKGRAELLTRELLMGQVKMGIDPVWESSNRILSGDIAHAMVTMRLVLQYQLALNPTVARVAQGLIDKNATQRVDAWTPTLATLTGKEGGKPVVVGVWDSGIDAPVFKGNLWTNSNESPNGTDDDANGFVDDIHGIAFDLEDRRVPELLHPVTEMRNDPALVQRHTKGLMDIQSSIDSPERSALVAYMRDLDAEKSGVFLEDLGLYGNVAHGTHVAGISLAGNPYARLLGVRLTFDFKSIPRVTPSVEQAHKTAANYQATVDYLKAAGVRVVNMSWGGSKQDVETQLEQKGAGKDASERDRMAREIFDIMSNSLRDAMASAPEILFVAAAGNSDNNNAFVEFAPSGLNLPNMVTVGAIDSSGKPTSFTTFGDNVTLYANGFEVDSFVPGGDRMKFSGTSMAAPQVTNLVGKMLALRPELKVAEVIDLLKRGSDPLAGKEGRLVINQKKTIGLIAKPN
jgi:subtilisin family serine protease